MKRMGIEGIYLGGWATSAKGSPRGSGTRSGQLSAQPGARRGRRLVRALLTADRNQHYARADDRGATRATPAVDYRPFIIADADTGHGGDAHVRNLIRRFVEVGVAGYHIEDQRPAPRSAATRAARCWCRGRADQAILRGPLPARRHGRSGHHRRPHRRRGRQSARRPRATSATSPSSWARPTGSAEPTRPRFWPSCGAFHERASRNSTATLYAVPTSEYAAADAWLERSGISAKVDRRPRRIPCGRARPRSTPSSTRSPSRFVDRGRTRPASDLRRVVADVMRVPQERGRAARDERRRVARLRATRLVLRARQKARSSAADEWDCERPRRPKATTRCAAASSTRSPSRWRRRRSPTSCGWRPRPPTCATPGQFAEAIHAQFPDKMLAYNLSPSFSWDTTGMSDEEMRRFPEELGKLGFVFNFITYGGHQIDGLAAEEFATALKQDGMLALARLQRKFRCSSRPTARRRRSSGAARGRRAGPCRGARRRPRRWARARRSSSTWCRPRCRRSCWRSGWRCGAKHNDHRQAAGLAAAPPRRLELLELGGLRLRETEARQRGLRPDPGPAWPQHPLDARPEHLRGEPAPEAADDARPPVPGAPLQGRVGALRHAQPRTTTGRPRDEVPRHLQRGQRRGR
jgi:isocitrate lyase